MEGLEKLDCRGLDRALDILQCGAVDERVRGRRLWIAGTSRAPDHRRDHKYRYFCSIMASAPSTTEF